MYKLWEEVILLEFSFTCLTENDKCKKSPFKVLIKCKLCCLSRLTGKRWLLQNVDNCHMKIALYLWIASCAPLFCWLIKILALWTCQNLVWVYFRTVRTMTFNIVSLLSWKPEKKVLPCSQGPGLQENLHSKKLSFIRSFKLDIIIHVLQSANGLPFAIHHRDNTETDNHSLSYSLLLRLWNHQLT